MKYVGVKEHIQKMILKRCISPYRKMRKEITNYTQYGDYLAHFLSLNFCVINFIAVYFDI